MASKGTRIIPCPACGKMTPYEQNPFRPFCSRVCKGIDFIRWSEESYRVSKDEQDESFSTPANGE